MLWEEHAIGAHVVASGVGELEDATRAPARQHEHDVAMRLDGGVEVLEGV